jgi:hypothetical protein
MPASVCLSSLTLTSITLTICIDTPLYGKTISLARSTNQLFPVGLTNYIVMQEYNFSSGYTDLFVNLLFFNYYYRLVDDCGRVISNTLKVSITS